MTPTHPITKRGSAVLMKLLIGSKEINLMIGDNETNETINTKTTRGRETFYLYWYVAKELGENARQKTSLK